MKKKYISATPLAMYLTELPIIAIFTLSIIFNDSAGGFAKLYPLIIASALGIAFVFIYLFRLVIISTDEVKAVGLYSSRDKAVINKGKTLILTLKKKGRLVVTLFGNDGERPALDWAQGEGYMPIDINLFREKVEGKAKSVSRILTYFDIPREDIAKILESDNFNKEYDSITVSTEITEDKRDIKILFTETI